jgi:hypothetical protein
MKNHVRIAAFSVIALMVAACAPEPKTAIASKTVQEIMVEMVGPSSNTLWASVSLIETDDGLEEQGPQTEAEWLALRQSAESMVAASALLTWQGLSVAPAGTPSGSPGVELEPAQIEALIEVDRDHWDRLSRALGASGRVFLDAAQARDPKPLLDAGDGLNTTCQNCHQVFWYPST